MNQRRKEILTKTLLYLLVIVLAGITLFPFLVMISNSLKSLPEIRESSYSIIPKVFRFDNYVRAMQQGNWPRYFLNTIQITVVSTVVSLLTNSIAGYAFARLHFKGRDLLFKFSLIGMMIPMQVVMIPIFLRIRSIPLLGGNNILGVGGTGLINTTWGVVLPLLAGPFGVFMCRQFYMNVPTSLDEAAKLDGCTPLRTYFMIYLPLSKPILATLAVLKATDSWNQYTWPLVITSSDELRTLQLGLTRFRSESTIQWDLLMAATVIVCVPVLIFFLFLQKYYVQGLASSGSKES